MQLAHRAFECTCGGVLLHASETRCWHSPQQLRDKLTTYKEENILLGRLAGDLKVCPGTVVPAAAVAAACAHEWVDASSGNLLPLSTDHRVWEGRAVI